MQSGVIAFACQWAIVEREVVRRASWPSVWAMVVRFPWACGIPPILFGESWVRLGAPVSAHRQE